MGLMIHSLAEVPLEARRRYYLHMLDYGWEEPVMNTVDANFRKLASLASENESTVVRGLSGAHFADEVLSWHQINGQPAEGMLPAILITTGHPQDFQLGLARKSEHQDAMLLIPLRKACRSATDVIPLLERLFEDIKKRKALSQFRIAKELKKGEGGAVVDAIILQPNFQGVGVDLKKVVGMFKANRASK